ncbi:hypothetical protein BKA56DRAFT_677105 [Ilyonectria sp. MPI-CAGE-AT-0026]|nr:hypothetical protein BKA56DRAFT_677105 [Ilyonectria sp. MPI-CAGE-AT-0026]
MPGDELFLYCYGARLRMIQSSSKLAYDDLYGEILTYVNQNGNIHSSVEVLPNTIDINYTLPNRCEAEMKATLYYLNPELANCTAPAAGIELCLPDQCKRTYTVQSKDDSCVEVAVIHGTSWKNMVDWNAGIDSRCSNIWSPIPFWDRVLLVTPVGQADLDIVLERCGSASRGPHCGRGDCRPLWRERGDHESLS